MVKFTYKPFEEIIIHEIDKIEKQKLIERTAINLKPGETGTLYWANKILFSYRSMPETAEVIADQLKNIIHWQYVQFSFCENYESPIEVKTGTFINVIHVSNSKILNEFTKWINEQSNSPNPPF